MEGIPNRRPSSHVLRGVDQLAGIGTAICRENVATVAPALADQRVASIRVSTKFLFLLEDFKKKGLPLSSAMSFVLPLSGPGLRFESQGIILKRVQRLQTTRKMRDLSL
jgi:hypothetical protein